jgi:hypothetical protein
MSEESGTSKDRSGLRPVRTAGVIIILVGAFLVFVGPRLMRKFEEPPVVDVADILRGEVTSDIVLVRGVVEREGRDQAHIFLRDLGGVDEIIVRGISMLPVVRVQSWGWFQAGQEIRLPVRITRDADDNLLLVEVRSRDEEDRRARDGGQRPEAADSSAGPPPEVDSPQGPE